MNTSNMDDGDFKESLSHESESSFVILGLGSLQDQSQNDFMGENPSLNSVQSNKSANTYFTLRNSSTDGSKSSSKCSFSEDNIQEKLNELVKENYQLKETLNQNNLAIKSQLDSFFMWQQEVLKTHETHKQKFLETKDLILKLRKENLSLKEQLEEFLNKFSIINIPNSELNTQQEHLSTINESVKCDWQSEREELKNKNDELNKDLASARKEVSKLKSDFDEIVTENELLKEKIKNFQKNSGESFCQISLPNSEARAQISNLIKQLEEEKQKNLKLKDFINKMELKNTEAAPDLSVSCTEKLRSGIEKLNDMKNSLDHQNERFDGFNVWVTLTEEKLKEIENNTGAQNSLLSEIMEFKSHLNVEENAFKKKQESVLELRKQYIKLLDDYKGLQKQVDLFNSRGQSVQKEKENTSDLLEKLEAKNRELLLVQQESDNLKEEIKKLNSSLTEKVEVLEIQAELYKNDFNCEREAREKLVGEKEQMAEHIRLLQNRLTELGNSSSQENEHSESSPLESPGKKTTYMCPKCMFSFYSLQRCEEHIDECLNIHMYP